MNVIVATTRSVDGYDRMMGVNGVFKDIASFEKWLKQIYHVIEVYKHYGNEYPSYSVKSLKSEYEAIIELNTWGVL